MWSQAASAFGIVSVSRASRVAAACASEDSAPEGEGYVAPPLARVSEPVPVDDDDPAGVDELVAADRGAAVARVAVRHQDRVAALIEVRTEVDAVRCDERRGAIADDHRWEWTFEHVRLL